MKRLNNTVNEELMKNGFINFALFSTAIHKVTTCEASMSGDPIVKTHEASASRDAIVKESTVSLPKLSESILEQLKCDVSIAVTRVKEGSSTINMVSLAQT